MTRNINMQLPPEILSQIFLHCLPTSAQSCNSALQRIPLRLTHVCKLWHALACDLPALWASLYIECDSYSACPPLPVISTHLQRSGTHPLTFSLRAQHEGPLRSPTPHFHIVFATLIAARERWQSVFITLSAPPQSTVDAIAWGPSPMLRTFYCELVETDGSGFASIPLHALQECPKLESLTWVDPNNLKPLQLRLRDTAWPCLTFLHIDALFSVADCLTILHLSPCLTTAKLSRIALLSPPQYLLPHLTHRALHTLSADGPDATSLLNTLTLPTLAHLRLSADPFIPRATAGGLHAFLARSIPPLHTLDLYHVQYPEPEILRALALAPALHTLLLDDNVVRPTTALVYALHPTPRKAALCPLLRTLCLSGIDFLDSVCGAMVRARYGEDARANGVVALERVRIKFRRAVGPADRQVMHALRNEGMAEVIFSSW